MKPVPDRPRTLDEVAERWPRVRQSWLAAFDDCSLSSYFDLRFRTGSWSTVPAASGTIFHRFARAAVREMIAMDSETIPVGVALAILEDELKQRNVPPEERVKVPLREVPTLRWVVAKWARDNSFSVRHVVDLERTLEAPIAYVDDDGIKRERLLTGRPDLLIADPRDPEGAILPDWKSGWSLPPHREEGEDVSYEGIFQLQFYGFLVLRNYPALKRVKLREFYARRSRAREAKMSRDDLARTEEMLADKVMDLDRCLASGKPRRLRFPDVAPWNPSPGVHCRWCAAPHLCPIDADARERYAVTSEKRARKAVAELQVAEAVRKNRREGLRSYVEAHGPVPAKDSRGRLVFGLRTRSNGKPTLEFFTPEGADRAPSRKPEDRALEDALRRSAEAAREEEVG